VISSNEAPAGARAGTKWITSAEPVRLRDYFLRLGTHAEIIESPSGPLVLVESADLEIEPYLNSWVTINQIDASIMERRTTFPRLDETSRPRPRLGDLLLARGNITDSQLKDALAESYAAGELLGRVLLRHEWIFEDELARTLAEQLSLPYVNLRYAGVDTSLASLLPYETGMRFAAIPVCFRNDRVRVAFADPADEDAQRAVAAHIAAFECVVAELSDIEMALRTVHRRNGLS
jgi:hypothetical protein